MLPFFSPIRRVGTDGIASQGGLDHGPVDALPAPGNALHLVVFGQSGPPQGDKEAGLHPPHEVRVNGARAAVTLLRQRLPLASGAQHIQNGFKDLSGRHGLSAAAWFAPIPLAELTFRRWDQRLHLGPERVRDFPGLYIGHDSSRPDKMSSGRICIIKRAKSIFYLRISFKSKIELSAAVVNKIDVIKEQHHVKVPGHRQIALRNKTNAKVESVTLMRCITDGDACEEKILLYERAEGRWPIKVSHMQGHQGPRCDIISFQSESESLEYISNQMSGSNLIKRFIEVKGRSSEKGAIVIKGNALNAARIYAEKYYLYRLYEKNNEENILLILNNPLEHKEAFESIIEIDLARANKTEKYQLTFTTTSDEIDKP